MNLQVQWSFNSQQGQRHLCNWKFACAILVKNYLQKYRSWTESWNLCWHFDLSVCYCGDSAALPGGKMQSRKQSLSPFPSATRRIHNADWLPLLVTRPPTAFRLHGHIFDGWAPTGNFQGGVRGWWMLNRFSQAVGKAILYVLKLFTKKKKSAKSMITLQNQLWFDVRKIMWATSSHTPCTHVVCFHSQSWVDRPGYKKEGN